MARGAVWFDTREERTEFRCKFLIVLMVTGALFPGAAGVG